MPSIQVTGQLVDPTTGVEGSADIRIASLINYGQTTKKSISHESTDASGNYDFHLVHGKHLILVKFDGDRIYNKIGYAVVGDSTPDPIDLIQLINLSDENPPSELVTELQQLREDTLNDIVSTSAEVLENAGYQGEWVSGTSTALKGETWQVSGRYYVALKNTSVDPINDNNNWREDVTTDYVTTAQNDIVGGSIFKGSNGEYIGDGDVIPTTTTHIQLQSGLYRLTEKLLSSKTVQSIDKLEVTFTDASTVVLCRQEYASDDIRGYSGFGDDYALETAIKVNQGKELNIRGNIDISAEHDARGVILKFFNGTIGGTGSLYVASKICAPHVRIFGDSLDVRPFKYTYIGETNRPTDGRWMGKVKAAWWGAVGDGQYPDNYIAPVLGAPASGTDSSVAIRKAAKFTQLAALIYSNGNGWAGGVTLEMEPQALYRVDGNNILGQQFQIGDLYAPVGELVAQVNADTKPNYYVKGNDCIFAWNTLESGAGYQYFIDSKEDLSKQRYEQFSVMPCGFTGVNNALYSNLAASGQNNNTQVEFTNVNVDYGVSQLSSTHGLDRLFVFTGDNLGDRFKVDKCSFRNFKTILRSSNQEAVSQNFFRSSFNSSINNGRWFDITNHASNINLEDCELLMKGDGIWIWKLEKSTPYGSAGFLGTMKKCRVESNANKNSTLGVVGYGKLIIENIQNMAGGPALEDSELVFAYGSGQVVLVDCAINTRLYVGEGWDGYSDSEAFYPSGSLTCGIFLERCRYFGDLSNFIYWRKNDASASGNMNGLLFQTTQPRILPVVVKDSPSYSATPSGASAEPEADQRKFIHDNVYFAGNFHNTESSERTVAAYTSFGSNGMTIAPVIDNDCNICVLPARSVITKIEVYNPGTLGTVDNIQIQIGTVVRNIAVSGSGFYELNEKILVTSVSDTERELFVRFQVGGVTTGQQGYAEVRYKPANQALLSTNLATRAI